MDWSSLWFLGEPWFVIPWYVLGAIGAGWVILDTRDVNTVLKPAIHWAWPIVVFFFSVIGVALYLLTARAPGVGRQPSPEAKQALHDRYQRSLWRRVNGAVIHCVAGDGLGIMTAMVVARAGGFGFWQEFWFEYAVGFAFGWFIFQRKSMTNMTPNLAKQLAMAFRGEFFSMLTVMGGMGAVMAYVTPLVVTAQPKPWTWAFWGFGMLGLLVGYVFTFPMNWMMVVVGWKHGMGGTEGAEAHEVQGTGGRVGLVAAMTVLGVAALFVPAWLDQVRQAASRDGVGAGTPSTEPPVPALVSGVGDALDRAVDGLRRGDRTQAALALDNAFRAANVGTEAAPGTFHPVHEAVRRARQALQNGRDDLALERVAEASARLGAAQGASTPPRELRSYRGATVLDARGAPIGVVRDVRGDTLDVAIGGWHHVWGVLDLGGGRPAEVPAADAVFGTKSAIGPRLVVVDTSPA